MKIEALRDQTKLLEAAGFTRAIRAGSLDLYWRSPDGRLLDEAAALAELKQDEEDER